LNDEEHADVEKLKDLKQDAKKSVSKNHLRTDQQVMGKFSTRFRSGTKWADLSKTHLQNLANQLKKGTFQVNGKVL
jgi:predicted flavoprotein YhiN